MPNLKIDNEIVTTNLPDNYTLEEAKLFADELYADAKKIELVATPEELKIDINTARDEALESGLYIKDIGILDTDPKSVQRISGATILSILPILLAMYDLNMAKASLEDKKILKTAYDSFKTPWITKDNKTVHIGLKELQLIAPALAKNEELHVTTARKHKDMLKEASDHQAVIDRFNQELSQNKKERDGATT